MRRTLYAYFIETAWDFNRRAFEQEIACYAQMIACKCLCKWFLVLHSVGCLWFICDLLLVQIVITITVINWDLLSNELLPVIIGISSASQIRRKEHIFSVPSLLYIQCLFFQLLSFNLILKGEIHQWCLFVPIYSLIWPGVVYVIYCFTV